MKCVNCSEEIIQSITGWRSASKPHRSICDPTDGNSRFHEPEPTEAAPLTKFADQYCGDWNAPFRENKQAEREAVVGGQKEKHENIERTIPTATEDLQGSGQVGAVAEDGQRSIRSAEKKVGGQPPTLDQVLDYVYGNNLARVIPSPQPETPRPEMGKLVEKLKATKELDFLTSITRELTHKHGFDEEGMPCCDKCGLIRGDLLMEIVIEGLRRAASGTENAHRARKESYEERKYCNRIQWRSGERCCRDSFSRASHKPHECQYMPERMRPNGLG